MNNRFAVILIVLVVLFGGIFFVTKRQANAPTNGNNTSNGQVTHHVEGDGKKGVTLVEYGDLQCPACTAYHPLVKQVVEKYKSDITFQYVNFPLVQLHQNAMAAHRAVEAASNQGKFWEMHDMLYEHSTEWNSSSNPFNVFQGYASQLGLNIDQFKSDYASSQVNDVINADMAQGRKLGVNSTPTFYIDGKKVDQNPQDLESFNKLIDNAIAAKNQQ
jgi:protein-disulfide isomerase